MRCSKFKAARAGSLCAIAGYAFGSFVGDMAKNGNAAEYENYPNFQKYFGRAGGISAFMVGASLSVFIEMLLDGCGKEYTPMYRIIPRAIFAGLLYAPVGYGLGLFAGYLLKKAHVPEAVEYSANKTIAFIKKL